MVWKSWIGMGGPTVAVIDCLATNIHNLRPPPPCTCYLVMYTGFTRHCKTNPEVLVFLRDFDREFLSSRSTFSHHRFHERQKS